MNPDPSQAKWSDAARHADFTWYVPRSPELRDVWAGGFGFGSDGPSHLDTCALIGEVEVSVAVRPRREVPPAGFELRNLMHDLTFHYLFEQVDEVRLPFSLEFVADDRTLSVDGRAVMFKGVRIDSSSRWIGSADLGDESLQVTVGGAMPDFVLVPSGDVDLPELPRHHR